MASFRIQHVGIALAIILLIAHLWTGFSLLPASLVRSPQESMALFFDGPLRILFALVIALICEPPLTALLKERFITATRVRVDIRRFLTRQILVVCGLAGATMLVTGLALASAGYWIAPALFPDNVSAESYGLTDSAAILEQSVATAPLTQSLAVSPVTLVLSVAAWMAVSGIAFALVSALSALIISNTLVAMIVPFLWYFGTSAAMQIAGLPELSFTITTPYPYGLTNHPFVMAAAPVLVTLVAGVVGSITVVARAPRLARFS